MSTYFETLERQRADALKFIQEELGLVPEAIGGLYSYVEGVEDVTCLSLKKLYGMRDKARAPV
ncbi:MAG: hypothetical protein QXK71_07360 [Pyrobaculum sp.]